ncbi:MAG: hypothetical protein CYG60_16695 [Actinobacteria bacterium]|nr:MAG: hypothetical protein CYG60_16695 [Actinomycetota bacterium]
MSVASVTELSATSDKDFEDAIRQAIARATQTLRGVEGCWVKDMNVFVENGNISAYKVNVVVSFVLEDEQESSAGSSAGATESGGSSNDYVGPSADAADEMFEQEYQ